MVNVGLVIQDMDQIQHQLLQKGNQCRIFVTQKDPQQLSFSTALKTYNQEGADYQTVPKRQLSQLSLQPSQDKKKKGRQFGNDS